MGIAPLLALLVGLSAIAPGFASAANALNVAQQATLLLLLAFLMARGEVGKPLNEAAGSLLRYLPLLLVPAAVGVMVYAQAIVADFWAIVGALVLSLLLSLLFTGWLMQKLIDRQTRRRGEP